MIIVVDVTKGIQVQTLESLMFAKVFNLPILCVINKIDLIEDSERMSKIERVIFI